MTSEEKYQLINNFIDKLIADNKSVNVSEQWDVSVIQSTNYEGAYPDWAFYIHQDRISYNSKADSKLKLVINNDQYIELKYKVNQLIKFSEIRAIKSLNEQ